MHIWTGNLWLYSLMILVSLLGYYVFRISRYIVQILL